MDRPAAGPVLVLRCLGQGSGMRSVQGKVGAGAGMGGDGREAEKTKEIERGRETGRREKERTE